MVNTLWAFATMNVPAPALFNAIADNAGRLAAEGNAQNLSNAGKRGRSDRLKNRLKNNKTCLD